MKYQSRRQTVYKYGTAVSAVDSLFEVDSNAFALKYLIKDGIGICVCDRHLYST